MENNYQCYHPKPALVFDSEKGISSSHTCIIIVIVKYQNISPSVKKRIWNATHLEGDSVWFYRALELT